MAKTVLAVGLASATLVVFVVVIAMGGALQAGLVPWPGIAVVVLAVAAFAAEHNAALRQLANRLVGILHGCLKTRTLYDEATAWSHHHESATAA